ncbi:MAG: AMP-binding protein [Syntrophaceae bacterium]|nr:AMP-binding protein [Syntrophaceae bacterium]
MSLIDRYLNKTEFDSYEDFKENYKINVPAEFNFGYDVVDVYAKEDPDKRAIVYCDDFGTSLTFSFADMKRYSNKAANMFKKIGIKKGDPVMLVCKGRYEFWFLFVALHKIGAIGIPATHMLTTKDIVYRVERADIKNIVCINDPDLAGYVEEAETKVPGVLTSKIILSGKRDGWVSYEEEMAAASDTFEKPIGADAPLNSDIMILYFTSGTVGMPKMVQHDFTYPLGHIHTARYWQNVEDNGLHYTVADTGWAKAVWGKIYGQWLAGAAVFVYDYDQFDPVNVLKKSLEHKVTTFCGPPTVYRFLIKQDLRNFDFSCIKYCVTAGEPLNPEVFHQFLQQTGLRIMEGYGQTEMTCAIGTYPWMEAKPGSMGRVTPGYEIELINAEGKPAEIGEEGEIAINVGTMMPVGMFGGYYRDKDTTDRVWHDGWYYTGDMAWQDEDGYYWFVGRADDLIKSSGYRIGPFEVESALIQHPAVLECAITSVPDDIRGAIVKATVVLAQGYTGSDALVAELQDHVKKVTAPYKYPRIIEFATELPKTISGKIRRVAIRNKDKENI